MLALVAAFAAHAQTATAQTPAVVQVGAPDQADGALPITVSDPDGISTIEAVVDYDDDGFDDDDVMDRRGGGASTTMAVDLFGFYYLWEYGATRSVRVAVTDTVGERRQAVYEVTIAPEPADPIAGGWGGGGVVTPRSVAGLLLQRATEADVVRLAGRPARSRTAFDNNFFHDNHRAF